MRAVNQQAQGCNPTPNILFYMYGVFWDDSKIQVGYKIYKKKTGFTSQNVFLQHL
jgi:hypothetical protein